MWVKVRPAPTSGGKTHSSRQVRTVCDVGPTVADPDRTSCRCCAEPEARNCEVCVGSSSYRLRVEQEEQNAELQARMTANLETFVVRARRVVAHSLASDDKLINSLQSGETKFLIPSDGGDATIIVEVPPEEQMESLAARVRPVILESEDTYYAKA